MIVSLYNTDKKELVAIFRDMGIAGRYIFSHKSTYNSSRIWNAYIKNTKLHKNTNFDFPIAVRMAKGQALELLGENEFWISKAYPRMSDQKIRGMKVITSFKHINQ